jgi:hypothetical protein
VSHDRAQKDPNLWALRIYTERASPWNEYLDLPETETHPEWMPPLVNVWFNNSSFDMSASTTFDRSKATTTYFIDCYAYAPAADEMFGGHRPGDERASLEVQRAARLVRNYLMSATHTHLGLRGLVWRRWITSIEAFQPPTESKAAQMVAAIRLTLQVEFFEFSPQVQGVPLESISATVKRAENGQIYFEGSYPHP